MRLIVLIDAFNHSNVDFWLEWFSNLIILDIIYMSDLLTQHKLKHKLDNYILAKLDGESWLIPKVRMNCRQHLTMKFKLYYIQLI